MDHRLPAILRYTRIRSFAARLIALACSPAFATEPLVYANTCVEQESGDVAGYVVIVQDGTAQPSISLSWSEGSLNGPAAATVTDYDRASGRLAFSVHVEHGNFHFVGKIEADRLEGTISSPWEAGTERLQLKVLPRKVAYEPTAKCR